jgi:hypothetical protein
LELRVLGERHPSSKEIIVKFSFFGKMTSSSSSELRIPEDEHEGLVEYSKCLLAIKQLEGKKVRLASHAATLAKKFPFLLDIEVGGKKRKEVEKGDKEEVEEKAEEGGEKEKNKKRNQKLKEKRKKKKVSEIAEKKAKELLAESEQDLEKMSVDSSKDSSGKEEAEKEEEEAEEEEKATETEATKKKVSPFKKPARFSIKTPVKPKSSSKEGGLSPSVRSELQHVDASTRKDNTGGHTPVQE